MDVRATGTSAGTSHTIRRAIIAVAVTLGLMAGSVAIAPSVEAAPAATAAYFTAGVQRSFDVEMIRLINDARADNGLKPVREAKGLTDLSVYWSRYMLGGGTKGQLAHNPKAWTDVLSYGAKNRLAWGENVGKVSNGTVAAQVLFDAYMKSPGHRANILSPKYNFVGMGTFANSGTLYNTMEFTDKVESLTATKVVKATKALAKK